MPAGPPRPRLCCIEPPSRLARCCIFGTHRRGAPPLCLSGHGPRQLWVRPGRLGPQGPHVQVGAEGGGGGGRVCEGGGGGRAGGRVRVVRRGASCARPPTLPPSLCQPSHSLAHPCMASGWYLDRAPHPPCSNVAAPTQPACSNVTLNGEGLTGWEVFPLALDDLDELGGLVPPSPPPPPLSFPQHYPPNMPWRFPCMYPPLCPTRCPFNEQSGAKLPRCWWQRRAAA